MNARDILRLEDLPNVGPATAADLRQIGITRPAQLAGADPLLLYKSLCEATAARQDPCVLDVFLSAVRFMEGAPARPWWAYTAERKERWPEIQTPSRSSRRRA